MEFSFSCTDEVQILPDDICPYLDDIDRLIQSYIGFENISSIILFGSYARDDYTENSDIDLFVDSEKRKKINLSKFEKKLARGIHLIVSSFRNLPSELRSNVINGVILYGVIEIWVLCF